MKRVLVTGGNGFLGGRIVEKLLERGEKVTVLQRSQADELEKRGVCVVRGSLLDMDSVRKAVTDCGTVIHTAAKAGVWGNRKEFFDTNYQGTKNIVEGVREAGVGVLIHCSTPSVVFNGEAFEGADETLPYGRNWLCAYAESKALAEAAVLESAAQNRFKAVALRPHLIFGRGDPHLLPRVIERAKSGRLRIIGDGSNHVDITAVENAAIAHIQAMDWLRNGGQGGGAYFLSQGKPVNLWKWVNEILERLEIEPIRRSIPLGAAYKIGYICELFYKLSGKEDIPPMTRFVAVELAKSHWFSIEAAKRDFGYRPEKVSTEVALNEFLEHYSKAKKGRS